MEHCCSRALRISFKRPTGCGGARDRHRELKVGQVPRVCFSRVSSLGSARSGADVLVTTRTGPQHAPVDGKVRGAADCHFGATYFSRDLTNQGRFRSAFNSRGLAWTLRTQPLAGFAPKALYSQQSTVRKSPKKGADSLTITELSKGAEFRSRRCQPSP